MTTASVWPQDMTEIGTAAEATCLHCGGARPTGGGAFCCRGCETAYAIVGKMGLDQFYRRRRLSGNVRPLRPDAGEDADISGYATASPADRHEIHLLVDGLSCAACVWLLESVLSDDENVVGCRVNLSTRRMQLRWKGKASDVNRHVERARAVGFRLLPFDPLRLADATSRRENELLKAMAVAGFAASNIMLLSVSVWAGHVGDMGPATRDLMHWISAMIALPTIAYSGRPFFVSAFGALRAGRTNMDVPISIGVLLACVMSLWETATSGQHAYFDSAVALLFFLLVGRYLDARSRGRARSAAEHLMSLNPRAVSVLQPDGSVAMKSAESVEPGSRVLAAAGERIGIDGTVESGTSQVDSSLVTGESLPMQAAAGTPVFAGMVNLTAPLRIRVTATGSRTLLAEIVRLMEAAEHGRSRFVVLADQVARAYAPAVHTLAILTFGAWYFVSDAGWQVALLNAVAVLIITCPCALALAVPVVQVVASGRLMRQGILLKSPTALERLESVDTVIFDKTGTLTQGRLELVSDPDRTDDDLRLAASLAVTSLHPLSRALTRAAPPTAPMGAVKEHPGSGLSADLPSGQIRLGSRAFCGIAPDLEAPDIGPEIWLVSPGRKPVRFAFSDRPRSDVQSVVRTLKDRDFQIELLSGDRPANVAPVAKAAGIANWKANCTPIDKVTALDRIRAAGRHTLMVGDGLNDAPALAAADVSASPSTAIDVAQTAADIVFQGDRLAPVAEILDVARRAGRLVRQNLVLAIVYNLGAVPLAMAGKVTPLIAAIAMSTSSLLVIANALRLAQRGKAGA